MSKIRYIASFNGMGHQIKEILKKEGIEVPKGFFDQKDFYDMFMVVNDVEVTHKENCSGDSENCNCPDTVGVWFANPEEDKFLDADGNLVEEAPGVFYVSTDDVRLWA